MKALAGGSSMRRAAPPPGSTHRQGGVRCIPSARASISVQCAGSTPALFSQRARDAAPRVAALRRTVVQRAIAAAAAAEKGAEDGALSAQRMVAEFASWA